MNIQVFTINLNLQFPIFNFQFTEGDFMVTGWPIMSNPADDSVLLSSSAIAVTLLVANTAVMIYFVIRYSRKRNPQPRM